MGVIYPHTTRQQPVQSGRHKKRWLLKAALAVLGAAAIGNFALTGWFHNRTLPHTMLGGQPVGNMSFSVVLRAARQEQAVPAAVVLTDGTHTSRVTLQGMGVRRDPARTQRSLEQQRSWLPVVALFTRHQLELPLATDDRAVQAAAATLAPSFHAEPADAKVALKDARFTAQAAKDGHELNQAALGAAVVAALDRGERTIQVPTTRVAPKVTLAQVQKTAGELQKTLATAPTYTYGSGRQTASAADIASWYAPSGSTYALNDFAIRSYIAASGVKMGVHAANLNDAVARTKQALGSHTAATISLQPFAQTKTYHYCVSTRGATTAGYLNELKAKLVATYADLRGWSLDGQVQFAYAESGCDFTVWLTAPDQMTSFGAICDPYWSCEVEGNVIVNLERWQQATPPWNSYGGSLDDYRVMLLNHETGHMLGFGHTTCPGSGQPAPVMMQQSIELQGCTFNPWPTAAELAAFRNELGF